MLWCVYWLMLIDNLSISSHNRKDTGFTHIIEYFEREADGTMDKLSNSKLSMEELRYLQGRHSVSKEFLDRIDNMSK